MKLFRWCIILLPLVCFNACSTSNKSIKANRSVPSISQTEERKFNYFFLESIRKKNLQEYDCAFDLMKKAVEIDTTNTAARYELSNYYLQLGRPMIALEHLQAATRLDPNNYWYGMMEGHLLTNLNMNEQATKVYEKLSTIYPNKAEINYSLAEVYSALGKPLDAIKAFDKLEENEGVFEQIIMEKFKLYNSVNETDKAFNEINKLILTYPTNMQYKILLGDLYLEKGLLPEAKIAYEKAKEYEPDNVYLLVAQSNYFNKIGDIPESNKLVKEALVNTKLDVDTKIKILTGYLSTLLQKKESVSSADSLFTVIMEQHPQESEIHSLYAELLIATDRYEDAHEQLGFAVDLNPNDKRLWLQLLGIDLKKENWDGVVQTGTRALRYFPEMGEFYLYTGLGYTMDGKYKEGIQAYDNGLKVMDAKNVSMISDLWGQKGDTYFKMKEQEKAYQAYDEALKYNEKNIVVLNNYSYFLSVEKKDLKKAERMCAKVIELEPNNPTYLDSYAWIFFQQGDYTFAKFYIQIALSKDGNKSAELYDHYGDILFALEDIEGAVVQWKKAVELGKDTPILKKKIETKKYIEDTNVE